MSEIISFSDTISNQVGKIFLEVIDMISIQVISIAKTFLNAIRMTDLNLFRKTQYKILSDSLKVVSGAFNMAGKIFSEVLSAVDSLGS
jgi:hypothetical protein